MKVRDVMMRTPATCGAETNLGAAVEILWKRNCGFLPVVDTNGKVIGVVTDRDICMALGTRGRLPGEITVGETISGKVFACRPDDDVRVALGIMGQEKVRRLPVINDEGKVEGILSMDDIVVHAEAGSPGRPSELSYQDVAVTLKRLYQADLPELAHKSAAGS
ncbi:MAG TPA: CBS domain-containing protein [Candidatus Polarisedimenticolia bacterium]|nr:CBS domain-containing protein [Candidatus Polarisedimenticolia bacterium]